MALNDCGSGGLHGHMVHRHARTAAGAGARKQPTSFLLVLINFWYSEPETGLTIPFTKTERKRDADQQIEQAGNC